MALMTTSHAGRDAPGWVGTLAARMKGPGGYYNIGNALALTTGLAVQIAAVSGAGHERGAVLEAVRQYLFGSPGATALTVAIGIFFVSGEMYHRAWSAGFPPDPRSNWWGDFLSGVAGVVLTIALAAFGDLLLALVSGLLLAGGKFGSALVPEDYTAPAPNRWPNRFRSAVLASRPPGARVAYVRTRAATRLRRCGARREPGHDLGDAGLLPALGSRRPVVVRRIASRDGPRCSQRRWRARVVARLQVAAARRVASQTHLMRP
jgi:hypothetical protein